MEFVNGKNHPIYEMQNNPAMFETTNQIQLLGYHHFWTPPNSWPTTTHSFTNHNRPVQPLHEGSCFSSRTQLAGCAPRCAPRGKRTRRIVALNSWECNSCHYKSTLKQCFFSQLQLLVGIEPWRVVNGYSKCAVLNSRKWWLNLT